MELQMRTENELKVIKYSECHQGNEEKVFIF